MIAAEMEPNNGKLHPKIKPLPSFPHLDTHRQMARNVAPYRGRNIATPPDQSLENDVNAWRQAVTTASSQLEDERIRLLNLELLSRFGGTKHLAMNEKVCLPISLPTVLASSKFVLPLLPPLHLHLLHTNGGVI